MERGAAHESAGRSQALQDVLVPELTVEQNMQVMQRREIAASARYDVVNYGLDEDYFLGSHRLCVCGTNEAFVTEIIDYIQEGRFPEKPDEILLTENAASIYGTSIWSCSCCSCWCCLRGC